MQSQHISQTMQKYFLPTLTNICFYQQWVLVTNNDPNANLSHLDDIRTFSKHVIRWLISQMNHSLGSTSSQQLDKAFIFIIAHMLTLLLLVIL